MPLVDWITGVNVLLACGTYLLIKLIDQLSHVTMIDMMLQHANPPKS